MTIKTKRIRYYFRNEKENMLVCVASYIFPGTTDEMVYSEVITDSVEGRGFFKQRAFQAIQKNYA